MATTPNRLLEVRVYTLKPGGRGEFDRLFREGAMPLLVKHGITVVGFGPSLHDPNGYFLMRAYPSLEERARVLEGFYGSEEWLTRWDPPVMALIDSYGTVVIDAGPEAIEALALRTVHA